jgi:hypothetical protein
MAKRGILVLLGLAIGCAAACTPLRKLDKPGSTTKFEKRAAELDTRLKGALKQVEATHRKGNALTHIAATVRTLRLLRHTSIAALLPEIDLLAEAVSRNGVAPYQTLLIDIGYRLARADRPETRKGFAKLAAAVLHAKSSAKSPAKMSAVLRHRGVARHRAYDAATANAIATLAFSEFGHQQFVRGQSPTDLARTLTMAWACQKMPISDTGRDARATKDCLRFADVIANELKKAGQGDLLSMSIERMPQQSRVNVLDCLDSDATAEFIDSVESYVACMAAQGRPPSQVVITGSSVATDWSGPVPSVDGYEHVDSKETVIFSVHGDVQSQVAHRYKNQSGGEMTITDYSGIQNGKEETGRHVSADDGSGNSYEQRFNEQGELVFEFKENADGSVSTFEKTDDGGGIAVATDKDGNSQVEVTDSQGNVKAATIDENGQCSGDACTASTPVDDTFRAACSPNNGDSLRADPTVDPLGPYIYPSPDDSSRSPELDCMVASLGSQPVACPPSVMLCLEPPPPGSCTCGQPHSGAGSGGIPSSRCHQIQCAEGTCDPLTGICSQGGNSGPGGVAPGIQPPVGPRWPPASVRSTSATLPVIH